MTTPNECPITVDTSDLGLTHLIPLAGFLTLSSGECDDDQLDVAAFLCNISDALIDEHERRTLAALETDQ